MSNLSFQDAYDRGGALYYFIQVLKWIYFLGSIAYLVLIMNVTILHTIQNPPSSPGTLISQRYNSFVWVFLMLSVISHIGMALVIFMFVLWRKDRGCTIFWTILMILFLIISVFVVAMLGSLSGNCNGQNQAGNICNDLRWCCAPEIYTNPANLCQPTGACPATPVTLHDLSSNVDFRWLFAVSIIFMLLNIVLLIVLIYLRYGGKGAKERVEWPNAIRNNPGGLKESVVMSAPVISPNVRERVKKKQQKQKLEQQKSQTVKTGIVASFNTNKNK